MTIRCTPFERSASCDFGSETLRISLLTGALPLRMVPAAFAGLPCAGGIACWAAGTATQAAAAMTLRRYASLLASLRRAGARARLGHRDHDRAAFLGQVLLGNALHVGRGDLLVVLRAGVNQVRVVIEGRELTQLDGAGQRAGQRGGLLPDRIVVRLLDFPIGDRPVLHLFDLFVERRFNVRR